MDGLAAIATVTKGASFAFISFGASTEEVSTSLPCSLLASSPQKIFGTLTAIAISPLSKSSFEEYRARVSLLKHTR